MDRAEYAVSAGASGAIFAVIGALIWIVLRNKGKLEGYSSQRLILMAGLSVVNGLTETGIDNWAHIGGLAGGWIVLRNKGKLEGYSSQRLILMAGLSVVNGLTETGIDNWAHIGGLAGGFLLAVLLYRKKTGAMQKES